MNAKNKNKWFTLVEVIVVVVIIGILVASLLPKIQSLQWRTRDTKRKTDIYTISNALETYYLDKGKYPHSFSWIYISSNNNPTERIPDLLESHLSSLPVDPLNSFTGANGSSIPWNRNSFSYVYHEPDYLWNASWPQAYTTNTLGKRIYQLMANLENPEDQYVCNKLWAVMQVRYYSSSSQIIWPVCRNINTYQSYFSVMPAQTTQ